PEGQDGTEHCVDGAREARAAARAHGVAGAVLKESSPSCGVHRIYDGAFGGNRVPGEGVTARLLADGGVAVFTEDEIADAAARLRELEGV
ncbi:DUF523 domain-containing protein, partial [Nocardiopsis dassonvillei]|uniref:DUF523 domain-containing protein n=1 Tax=Nocardiopsis dassonvillei TaxID=2014 RepID=UPI002010360D